MPEYTIALLIDADNVSAKFIESILSELTKYGKVTIRRMYGDWSQNRLKPWLEKASRFSLTPIMESNDTPTKNASDIGMVIDAMDILFSEKVNGFCIVSSDADFNKLAKRLRESGNLVIGIGEQKTPESFRASCEKFISLDIFEEETNYTNILNNGVTIISKEKQKKSDNKPFTSLSIIENSIVNMLLSSVVDSMSLGEVGSKLSQMYPDFDVRNYSFTKLSELLKEMSNLALTKKDNTITISIKNMAEENLLGIEKKIIEIYKSKKVDKLNIGELKKELTLHFPNLNLLIKKSGVTKFSVFIDKKISAVKINGNNAVLSKTIKN